MKKIIVTIFLSFCCELILPAQTFQWAGFANSDHTAGTNAKYGPINICCDVENNIYVGISINGNQNIILDKEDVNVPPLW